MKVILVKVRVMGVLVEGALDADGGGKADVAEALVVGVGGAGDDLAVAIVDVLAVGE